MAKKSPSKKKTPPPKPRPDGRTAILLYMKPDLILELKEEAMLDGRTAFSMVESAVAEFLARRRRKKAGEGTS